MALAVSVIVMAYNEAFGLGPVVQEIVLVLDGLGRQYEVVIINDGSSDDTGLISRQLSERYSNVRTIHHSTNQGLGGVYRSGFSQARYDLITFFPADGQFPASIIQQFIPKIENVDMVLGYLPIRNASLSKYLSMAEKILYTLLFGRMPKFQGVFMFKRTMLDEIHLQSSGRGWAVVLELIIKASRSNYKLVSVPTEIRPRIAGKSKVNNIRTILENLVQAIELRRYL